MCKNGQIGKIDNILTIFPVNSLHFRELPRRFAKIYQRSLPSLLQSPCEFKIPPFLGGILNLRVGSNANCLALRRDLKPAAMSEFALKAQGEDREGRPEQNFRQEIYAGRIPSLLKIVIRLPT